MENNKVSTADSWMLDRKVLKLADVAKKYHYSESHIRTLLSRPEFVKHRDKTKRGYFNFFDTSNFHTDVTHAIRIKRKSSRWKRKEEEA